MTSVRFGWNDFAHRSQAIENYFNQNPSDLYDYSIVKKAHGWDGLAAYATNAANKMLKNFEFMKKDSSGFGWNEEDWSFENEPSRDPNFYMPSPKEDYRICNHTSSLSSFIYFRYPTGGLNNQINEIIQFIAISHILNRTLILPRLFSDLKNNQSIGFGQLFDTSKTRLNLMGLVCVVTEDEFLQFVDLHISPTKTLDDVTFTAPHSREAPIDWYRREYNRIKDWQVLKLLRPSGLSHYLVKFFGPHARSLQKRIRNALVFAEKLTAPAEFVTKKLLEIANAHGQNVFTALHLRVEHDWREHCIKQERLWGWESEIYTPPRLVAHRMGKVLENKSIVLVCGYYAV